MIDDSNWARLDRYFAGECSEAEAAEIRLWINADPEREREVAFMRDAWTVAGTSPVQWDTEHSWQRLAARASARERGSTLRVSRAITPRASWMARMTGVRALATAACLVAAAVGGVAVYHARRTVTTRVVAQAAVAREYATRRGQLANITLSDGTQLMLGPESRLRIPTDYGERTRKVLLDGRAFFTVQHDSTRPFAVQTSRGLARDLGTEFVVSDYPSDHVMRVVVASGEVSVTNTSTRTASSGGADARTPSGTGVTLTRGGIAEIDSAGVTTVRSDVDVSPYLAWTSGRLEFDNVRLGDALPELARWYDVDIRLSDSSLAEYPVTANLTTESLPRALRVLTLVLDARAERHGNMVVLFRKSRTLSH